MGNDGGSIPTRRELVKEAARDPSTTQLKETQNEQQQYQWTTCALSHRPLLSPVVSDSLGLLYSKDAVIEHLLKVGKEVEEKDRSRKEESFDLRVNSIRDVVEVKFQTEGEDNKDHSSLPALTQWVCPITKKALGPGVKTVYLVPCGHAFLESAIKEMGGENCLQCNEPYTHENVIPIVPVTAEDIDRLRKRAQNLKDEGLTHSLKKAPGSGKKRKKNTTVVDFAPGDAQPKDQPSTVNATALKNIRNEETALLTAKVLTEEQDRNKRWKRDTNENLKTLFSSQSGTAGKQTDFMTRGYSIPAGSKR